MRAVAGKKLRIRAPELLIDLLQARTTDASCFDAGSNFMDAIPYCDAQRSSTAGGKPSTMIELAIDPR